MSLGGPARRPGRGEGNPRRDFKANAREFVDWIKENEAAGRPSYASVQPYHAYEEPLCIEKTFYDFDCKEDRERAGDDAHDFARRLRRFYGVEPLIAFSGNKGYHVYPFIEEPFGMGLSKPMLKAVYGWLQRMLLGNAKYETLGSSVLGDIAQLARVPYTHHEKTGRLCRPIDFRDLSHYREHGVTLDLCGRALNAFQEPYKGIITIPLRSCSVFAGKSNAVTVGRSEEDLRPKTAP